MQSAVSKESRELLEGEHQHVEDGSKIKDSVGVKTQQGDAWLYRELGYVGVKQCQTVCEWNRSV